MADSKDFRLGNYVLVFGSEVDTIKHLSIGKIPIDATPISITTDWLVRLGFSQFSAENGYKSRKWTLAEAKHVPDWFYLKRETHKGVRQFNAYTKGTRLSTIEYIHQLQNLYYCLTGRELTIHD